MTFAVNADSPPVAEGDVSSSTATTAAFTPNVGTVLIALVAANSSVGGSTTISVADSTGLAWTSRVSTNIGNVAGIEGAAAIFTAITPRIPREMMVTATTAGSTSTTRRPTIKVYAVTGADLTNPVVGAARVATGNTNNSLAATFTQGAAGSYLFVVGSDWNRLGIPTSSDLSGFEGFSNATAGVSGGFGYRQLDDTVGTEGYNLDAFGAAAAEWQACRIEIRAAAATTGTVIPGLSSTFIVEAAFGADLNDAPAEWTWTDITTDVRQSPGVSTRWGRTDEAGDPQPAACTLTLDNPDGAYALDGRSPNWPYVRRGTPIRVTVGSDFLFVGYATGWSPDWDSRTGELAVTHVEAAGTLRRLQQGAAPVVSSYRRAMTELSSTRAYWPMEDPDGATESAPVRGGTNLNGSGEIKWATNDGFKGSDPLPDMGSGTLQALVYPYADTGHGEVRLLLELPDDIADGQVLAYFHLTGSIARVDLTFEVAGGVDSLGVFFYNRDGTLNSSKIVTFGSLIDMRSNPMRFALQLRQSGADLAYLYGLIDQTRHYSVSSTFTIVAATAGTVSQVTLAPNGDLDGVTFGHITVEDAEQSSLLDDFAEFVGFDGDHIVTANRAGRLDRLCAENGIPLTTFGDGTTLGNSDRMGVQRSAPLIDLLRDAALVGRGWLFDGRYPGLAYVSNRYTESRDAKLTINAGGGELSAPFDVVHDDQQTRNRATVTRRNGATFTYEDANGPMGTSAIGVYDTSQTVNLYADDYTIHHAGWIVNLGTVEGCRYPTVTLDSRVLPAATMALASSLKAGDRIDITNVRSVLAWAPSDTVSLIVQGAGSSITSAGWLVTLNCSPFAPWLIGTLGSTDGSTDTVYTERLDTSGSLVTADTLIGTTSLSVSTTTGPLWTTSTTDYPMTLDVGGVQVTATACSGASSPQTFVIAAASQTLPAGVPVRVWNAAHLGI